MCKSIKCRRCVVGHETDIDTNKIINIFEGENADDGELEVRHNNCPVCGYEFPKKAPVEDKEPLSDCCGAPIYEDTDICTQCKEHCAVSDE